MNQTRFNVLQSSFEVSRELLLTPRPRGGRFVMTLVVNLESGIDIPLEIYVDRISNGMEGLVYSAPGGKGTLAFRTVAHARADSEEGCDIDIFFGPGDQKKAHPSVEVPPDFVELIREAQAD